MLVVKGRQILKRYTSTGGWIDMTLWIHYVYIIASRRFACVQHYHLIAFFRWTFAVWLGRSHSESHGNQLSTGKTQLKQAHGEPVLPSQRLAMLLPLLVILQLQNSPFLKSRHPKKKCSFLKSDLRVLRMIRQGWESPTWAPHCHGPVEQMDLLATSD